MFLREALDKIVFSSAIAVNGMLASHCDNLSTHHHLTDHSCFDMQFHHGQTMQQFCAVAMSSRKSESDQAALLCQIERLKEKRKQGSSQRFLKTLNNK